MPRSVRFDYFGKLPAETRRTVLDSLSPLDASLAQKMAALLACGMTVEQAARHTGGPR